jgi:hypothetical protein
MENCENRNDPDFVQAFLKKWWVCALLTQCMGDYGAKFQSAFNPKDAKTVRKFFDIVCIKR